MSTFTSQQNVFHHRHLIHFAPDAEEYYIRDGECEKKYRFSLVESLAKVRDSGPFLTGWSVYVSGKCEPKPAQLKEIIGIGIWK